MRMWFTVAICAALLGGILPSSLLAQQKTVKACQDEWRANKADSQAKGITEKAYVAQCRAGGPSAQPASAPAATPPSAATPAPKKTVKACQDEWKANRAAYQAARITEKAYVDKCRAGETVALPTTPVAAPTQPAATSPSATSSAPKKTVKACQDEWRANRAAYQTAHVTEKAYVDKCRAGEAIALPTTPAAAPTPAPTTASPAPAPPSTPEVRLPPTRATPAPAGAGQFQTEAQAKSQCPADLVVWVNLPSKIYHFAGHKSYGTTKTGAYMCEKEAAAQGFRASKTEKRPST
jgi:hypothetical protein